MRVIQINTRYKYGGSTGRIVSDLHLLMDKKGIENYVAYGFDFDNVKDKNTFILENNFELTLSKIYTRIVGTHGFQTFGSTNRLLNLLDQIKPDVIHLHNIHNHYINVEKLFTYLKKHSEIKVIWTLHDCWAFTGWCAYFDYIGCYKWQKECNNCPALKEYPHTWFFDHSRSNFFRKKKAFLGIKNMTIVTPSIWLKNMVKQSFLKDYNTVVINNGIDLDLFRNAKYTREELGIPNNKFIILALADGLQTRKGAKYLLELPQMLEENEILVVAGVKPNEVKELNKKNCIPLLYSNDIYYLASLYCHADVFINPTLSDNFPTTNLEALACGTPVITFNTGGSPEAIDKQCGYVVEQGDITSLIRCIKDVKSKKKETFTIYCRNKATINYDKWKQFEKYITLYNKSI